MSEPITVTYLEQRSPAMHRLKPSSDPRFNVRKLGLPLPSLNRYFYQEVGRDWRWTDKLSWSMADWQSYAARVSTFVGYYDGTPVGYFELEVQPDAVQLAYFGLLPEFVGQGLGGPLLSEAISAAWALTPARIWVHTCTLDHPAALANYQARGFEVYKQDVLTPGTHTS